MTTTDVFVYLDEILGNKDIDTMSHKAVPGLAVMKYIKANMGKEED